MALRAAVLAVGLACVACNGAQAMPVRVDAQAPSLQDGARAVPSPSPPAVVNGEPARADVIAGILTGTPGRGLLNLHRTPTELDAVFGPLGITNSATTRHQYRDMVASGPGIARTVQAVSLDTEGLSDRSTFIPTNWLVGVRINTGYAPLPGGNTGEVFPIGNALTPQVLSPGLLPVVTFCAFPIVLSPTPSSASLEYNSMFAATAAQQCFVNLIPTVVSVEWDSVPTTTATQQATVLTTFSQRLTYYINAFNLDPSSIILQLPISFEPTNPPGPGNVTGLLIAGQTTAQVIQRSAGPLLGGVVLQGDVLTDQQPFAALNAVAVAVETLPRALPFRTGVWSCEDACLAPGLALWQGTPDNLVAGATAIASAASAAQAASLGTWSP